MLAELHIQNFALIENAHLKFTSGLNVITGETGAGKSILLGAINLVLGGKASAALIRQGSDEAMVEALFCFPAVSDKNKSITADYNTRLRQRLTEMGIAADEDDEIVIRRVIARSPSDPEGKKLNNRIFINGQLSTRQNLLHIAQGLVDLCGQREHQTLLDPQNQARILDRLLARPELPQKMAEAAEALASLHARWKDLTENEAERLKRRDYLGFQIREIDSIDPKAGEDETLEQETNFLAHAEELRRLTQESLEALELGQTSILAQLRLVSQNIEKAMRLAGGEKKLERTLNLLKESAINLEESQRELDAAAGRFESDPERLAACESRLHALITLKRKYAGTLEEILTIKAKLEDEFMDLDVDEEALAELLTVGQQTLGEARAVRRELKEERQKTAAKLKERICKELTELGMAGAQFGVELIDLEAREDTFPCKPEAAGINRLGQEKIHFLFAPNQGEGFRTLHEIISGGELSRVLLALKCILSPAEFTGSYLFDEIDSGVGGLTGSVVGKKLKALSANRQVICITHLPQIASFADHHFRVAKETTKARTKTSIDELNKEERIEELARMLGGDKLTETSRSHAKTLIAQSSK